MQRPILPQRSSGFWLRWLTSQARYVRVYIPRRAMHASCESPWHCSAKHHILGACFSRMAPFRTRFSPCKMAYIAYVQRLIGRLYALGYCYIPTCRFTAQAFFVEIELVAGGALPSPQARPGRGFEGDRWPSLQGGYPGDILPRLLYNIHGCRRPAARSQSGRHSSPIVQLHN